MSVKRGVLLGVALALLGLLPRLAAGQGPIVSRLEVIHKGEVVTSSARAGSLALFTTLFTRDFTPGFLRSDGTVEGTFSIDPRGPATPRGQGRIRFANSHGSLVFFTCALHASPEDRSLWRSDGTVAGTFAVTEGLSLAIDSGFVEPPVSVSLPERGLELFSAGPRSAAPDFELWATDGTREGTRLVKSVNPKGPSNPRQMTALGGWLFFLADTPRGRQVWRSDGTPEGTALLHEISEQRTGTVTLIQAGGALFVLEHTESGVEVWRSDGSTAGTSRILELSQPLLGYRAAGRHLFLAAGDAGLEGGEMWAVDGVAGEAVRVLEAALPSDLGMLAAGDHVAFALRDEHGLEPWGSDGTPEGTRRIADVCRGPCDSFPSFVGTYRGKAVFRATNGISGYEPWLTDGTSAGTWRLGDLCAGRCDSSVGEAFESKGRLLLLMHNGGIWISDGTRNGAAKAGNVATPAGGLLIPPGLILFEQAPR